MEKGESLKFGDTAQSSGALRSWGEEAKNLYFFMYLSLFQICVRKLKNGPSYEMKTTFKT